MADERVAYELYDKGLFLDAANVIDRGAKVARDLLVLRALIESHIGSPAKAQAAAEDLLRCQVTNREQSTCWEVIGRVALSGGKISDGLRALRKAFETASALADLQRDARLLASFTESLLHCVGLDAAALEMPKLRQSAIKAGDAFSLIEFHSLDAEIKAKRGLLSAASFSIATARELLAKYPHTGQEARIGVTATGLTLIQGDYEAGLAVATTTLAHARSTGIRTVLIPALNNYVYIKLCLHEFDDIRPHLDQLLVATRSSGTTEIGILDTQMLFEMARNDLTSALALAEQIDDVISRQEERDSYYELWHQPTRIRLLYRTGTAAKGLQLALNTLTRAERRQDYMLMARLQLLASEGYSRTAQQSKAAIYLAEAVKSSADPSLEFIGESHRVSGHILASENETESLVSFEQASAIFKGIGNLAAVNDIQRDRNEVIRDVKSPVATSATTARTVRRVCHLLELGAHIPTLAAEAARLIWEAGCAAQVEAVEFTSSGKRRVLKTFERPSHNPVPIGAPRLTIHVGTHQARNYEISYEPLPGAVERIGLLSLERLIATAVSVVHAKQITKERNALLPEMAYEQQLGLICASERMIDLVTTIRRVAASNVTVLLTGETGVGKELFARALHQASARSDKVFLPFNCGTVPRDLLDSQLFGHRRGAFTGAHADAPGVIRSAAGGTLFLDEIGEMAIETQPKLLRFLEAGEILPLGETKPQTVDVRIVAATNANLDQMVADGRFREDLYYRLNVIRINIPPLRERREEVPALVEHFLERFGRELQKPMLRVADETLEYLVLYRWPGNVRQLANEIRRMVAFAEPGAVLMPAHLSDDIVASRRTIPAGNVPRGFSEVVTRIDQPLSAAIEHIERAAIQRALSMTDGNLIEAAKMLGLSRKGLYLKRQRLNLG